MTDGLSTLYQDLLGGSVSASSAARLLFGFIAGFVATLIFHQIGLLLLHFVGMTPNMPYNMNSVPPFGVPQFISLSFWGAYGASSSF